ncbi:AAA family ATPase [Cytobacillus gottheilii]|uniref:AAA family ATPase n=1 Tax=Cytobacillus gottheilii TaxID=859144 RepID=UPI0009BBCBEA|nr:AAA family ATPase [Cytobacillus gottheilii]
MQIYGYGKLVDKTYSSIGDFQVFYGENEAGKSTIMAFIHAILFGFPAKQQNESRYEPKEGNKYGGKLTAFFPGKGKAVIERVKGKSAGDVSVRMEDGTVGSEALLRELLHDMDKKMFQSIFSFNVHGLQNIHQMNGEDLGRLLFSAGALGTDQLLLAEQTLQKELESRFKPNGKKPALNQKLSEVKELYKKLQSAQQKNEEYWELLKEIEKLEAQIKSMQKELAESKGNIHILTSWKQIETVFKEHKLLEKELSAYKELVFPIDGLARYERLHEGQRPLLAKHTVVKQQIQQLSDEICDGQANKEILAAEKEIVHISEQLPLMQKLREEERALSIKLSNKESDIRDLSEKLNLSLSDQEVATIDTSIHKKKKVTEAEDEYKRLIAKKADLDEQFNESARELDALEKQVNDLKNLLLSSKEEAELQKKHDEVEERTKLEQQLQEMMEKQKTANTGRTAKRQQAKPKNEGLPAIIFASLFLILSIWAVVSREWLIGVASAAGLLYVLYHFVMKSKAKTDAEYTGFEQQQKDIENRLQELRVHDIKAISVLKAQNDERKQKLKELDIYLQQELHTNEKIIASFERWEAAFQQATRNIQELCVQLHLPSQNEETLEQIGEVYRLLEQLKSIVKEKRHIVEEHRQTNESLQALQGKTDMLARTFQLHPLMSYEEQVYELRKLLKNEIAKKGKEEEAAREKQKLEEEERKCVLEINQYQAELSDLLKQAKAAGEEHFRELAKQADTKEQIIARIDALHMQLQITPLTSVQMESLEGMEDEHSIEELTERIDSLELSIPAQQKKLAEMKYEAKLIEEGGTHAELLHRYKQIKSELEKDAAEWAKYAAAQHILKKTITAFKDERLPKIIAKAEEHLSTLTGGQYVRIWPKQEESGFLIENNRKTAFEVYELSQASKEQVYVALRLALAETAYDKETYPLIIDDSFVNFDHNRTERMIKLLRSLTNRQILFFTCHQHLLSHFYNKEIIELTAPALTQK